MLRPRKPYSNFATFWLMFSAELFIVYPFAATSTLYSFELHLSLVPFDKMSFIFRNLCCSESPLFICQILSKNDVIASIKIILISCYIDLKFPQALSLLSQKQPIFPSNFPSDYALEFYKSEFTFFVQNTRKNDCFFKISTSTCNNCFPGQMNL